MDARLPGRLRIMRSPWTHRRVSSQNPGLSQYSVAGTPTRYRPSDPWPSRSPQTSRKYGFIGPPTT